MATIILTSVIVFLLVLIAVLLFIAIVFMKKLSTMIDASTETTSSTFYQTQKLTSGQIRSFENNVMKHLDPNYLEK